MPLWAAPLWIRRSCRAVMMASSATIRPLGVNSIPNLARSRSVMDRPPWLPGAPDAEPDSWAGASNPALPQISRRSTSPNGSPVARSISQDRTNVLALMYS